MRGGCRPCGSSSHSELGTAAAGNAGAGLLQGFVSLAIFGLALSAPLIAAVAWPPARICLDRLTGFSRRVPILTSIVLAALGVWTVVFGPLVTLEDWV
jgi:cytochrome c-type biogenesis protein